MRRHVDLAHCLIHLPADHHDHDHDKLDDNHDDKDDNNDRGES